MSTDQTQPAVDHPAPRKAGRWNIVLTPGRCILILTAVECLLWLSEHFRLLPFNHHKGWTVLIAACIASLAFLLVVFWFIASLIGRRRFQFTIRSLLLLAFTLAIPCSWFSYEMRNARKQEEAVAALRQYVSYDCEVESYGTINWTANPTPVHMEWLGVDFFADITLASVASDDQLAGLSSFPRLERLEMYGDFSTIGLRHIAALTELETLKLTEKQPAAAETEWLRHLTKLSELTIQRLWLQDDGLQNVAGLKQLEFLRLNGAGITDAGLVHLRGLSRLKRLDLTENRLTGAGLKHLAALPQLKTLRLRATLIDDAGLESVAHMPGLERLDLGFTRITDAGLKHLENLGHLKRLSLYATAVTDAGLEHLAGLSTLEELDLDDTLVTDAGLEHLKGLTALQTLYVQTRGVRVTSNGAAKLRAALPNCHMDIGIERP